MRKGRNPALAFIRTTRTGDELSLDEHIETRVKNSHRAVEGHDRTRRTREQALCEGAFVYGVASDLENIFSHVSRVAYIYGFVPIKI